MKLIHTHSHTWSWESLNKVHDSYHSLVYILQVVLARCHWADSHLKSLWILSLDTTCIRHYKWIVPACPGWSCLDVVRHWLWQSHLLELYLDKCLLKKRHIHTSWNTSCKIILIRIISNIWSLSVTIISKHSRNIVLDQIYCYCHVLWVEWLLHTSNFLEIDYPFHPRNKNFSCTTWTSNFCWMLLFSCNSRRMKTYAS